MSEKPLKILLIEDDPGHARLIKAMLVDASTASTLNLPVTLVHADCLSTGLERLSQKSSFDLILLDLGLPESQGLTTFNRVHAQAPKVPIVAVTALMDETIGVKAIQAGAQDYLVKGRMDSNVLVRSIRYAIERKHAEAQLEKNRINYLNLIENSADGFVVTGRDGAILFVNPAAEAIFGRTLEELKGELFGFTIMAGESTEIDITRRGGETGTGEMRVTETEWEGEPAHLISIRDITERKQAEAQLEKNRINYLNLIENSADSIVVTGRDGAILFVNPVAEAIFGRTLEELKGELFGFS
ncbi:MAG: PAS domain S-box protein, partial [Methanosarcinales archaeon]|nr:PAS domain S-box protein [Methanosarcinales archaeon]